MTTEQDQKKHLRQCASIRKSLESGNFELAASQLLDGIRSKPEALAYRATLLSVQMVHRPYSVGPNPEWRAKQCKKLKRLMLVFWSMQSETPD